MKALGNVSMLTAVHASCWSGSKLDRDVTKTAADAYGASEDAGRFVKTLIKNEHLINVQNLQRAARRRHKYLTLPWDDQGNRLLPISHHRQYVDEIDDLTFQMQASRTMFINTYDESIEEAKTRLGSMFHQDEYPTKDEITERITLTYEFNPVPDKSHLDALTLPDKTKESLQDAVERHTNAKLTHGIHYLFKWAREVIGTVADRLEWDRENDKPKIVRASMLVELESLAQCLPNLNLTEDPLLTQLSGEMDDIVRRINGNVDLLRYKSSQFWPRVHGDTLAWSKESTAKLDSYFAAMKEIAC